MEFEIFHNSTQKDILEMIELDKTNYLGNDVGNYNDCVEWLKICPLMYTIIKSNNKIIGYINFLPITKQCYQQIKNGQKKDYELSSNDVLNFNKGDNYCLFMSIVINKEYRNSNAFNYLFNDFVKMLANLNENGIKIKNVIADCVTAGGERLARSFKGKFICKTPTKSSIYEFDPKDFFSSKNI